MTEPTQTTDKLPPGPTFNSIQQCAATTGIPAGKLRFAKSQGCPGFEYSRIALYPFLRWHFTDGQEGELLDLNQERARLAKEQADKLSLQNATKRGELKPWSEVTEYVSKVLAPMRDRILSVESLAAKVNPNDPAAARVVLQQWIDDTLRTMQAVTRE